jgi:hypothetical protein
MACCLVLTAPADAAFPGRNGELAVQPLDRRGLVVVDSNGRQERRICMAVSTCGHPARPMFSPDGRSIVFAGVGIRLVGTDGSCQDCRYGFAASPAFLPIGTVLSFPSGSGISEDSIDGIREQTLPTSASAITSAIWSAHGTLAVASRGRVLIGTPQRLRSSASTPRRAPGRATPSRPRAAVWEMSPARPPRSVPRARATGGSSSRRTPLPAPQAGRRSMPTPSTAGSCRPATPSRLPCPTAAAGETSTRHQLSRRRAGTCSPT